MLFANLAVTSFLVWNVGLGSNETPANDTRVKSIQHFINLINPDICVLQDFLAAYVNERCVSNYFRAHGQDIIHDLFPDYIVYIFPLQDRGDKKLHASHIVC